MIQSRVRMTKSCSGYRIIGRGGALLFHPVYFGNHRINHVLRTEHPSRLPFLVKLHSNHLKYVGIPA